MKVILTLFLLFATPLSALDRALLEKYYVQQKSDASCSLATLTMVINALRDGEKPLTQEELLDQVGDANWEKAVAQGGDGVTLDQFGEITRRALKLFHLDHLQVTVYHLDSMPLCLDPAILDSETFVILNFDQAIFLELEENLGHISPLGRVQSCYYQILDVDYSLSNPFYWVDQTTFLRGMNSRDSDSSLYRGYLIIK